MRWFFDPGGVWHVLPPEADGVRDRRSICGEWECSLGYIPPLRLSQEFPLEVSLPGENGAWCLRCIETLFSRPPAFD